MSVITQYHESSETIGEIILNKPEVHNAFDDEIIQALITAIQTHENDPKVRAIWLKSTGKNFSAGADLNWMKRMAQLNYEENLADANKLAELMHSLYATSKPTLVSVQGAAFGGALGLIACCDIAVATEKASFCLSEVKIGLIPAVISPYVIKAIGERASQRYFLTAERFNCDEAHRLGLVHEQVETDALEEKSLELIQTLSQNGPNAVRQAKQLIRDVAPLPPNEKNMNDNPAIAITTKAIAAIRVSEEGQEGLSSFLEKRAPNWK